MPIHPPKKISTTKIIKESPAYLTYNFRK